MLKNVATPRKVIYGVGGFAQINNVLDERRSVKNGWMLIIIDNYFEGNPIVDKIKLLEKDHIEFVDIKSSEPTTVEVDRIRDWALSYDSELPSAVVGMGGGSAMDYAKAVSLMLTHDGPSQNYQGKYGLLKRPGVYTIGIPTISGTGAECSMPAVLSGPEKKMGLNGIWVPFRQIILDPNLIESVPIKQWFYTGMDCYIHNVESHLNYHSTQLSRSLDEASLKLCEEVFLQEGQTKESNEKLMIASFLGGKSIGFADVAACHALSYGLSHVFKYRHGLGNCIVFQHLEDIYGDYVVKFNQMCEKNDVQLPQNLSANWSYDKIKQMVLISMDLPFLWENAFGPDWRIKITMDYLVSLYKRM